MVNCVCVGDYPCRDVDETISWIKEKEQLMASDDFGRDLASVQALLRKHEGLERDLAALEDKVRTSLSRCRWPGLAEPSCAPAPGEQAGC